MITCTHISDALRNGQSTEVADLRRHIEQCDACAALVEAAPVLGGSPQAQPEAPEALFAGIENAVAKEAGVVGRLRGLSTSARRAAVAATAAVTALVVFLVTPRADLGAFPAMRFVLETGAVVAVLAVALVLAVRGLHRAPLRGGLVAAAALVAVLVPVGVALLGPAHVAHEASLAGGGDDLIARALGCFMFGTLTAAPVLALAWASARTAVPITVGAIAALAGVTGVVALQLHCPITLTAHLLLGHATVTPVLLLLVAGVRAAASRS